MSESESTPADFADVFDDWIAGASITRRSVVVYGKPSLFAEFQRLEREREVLVAEVGDEPEMGDTRLAENEAAMQAVYDEWMGSKSEWILRALTDADIERVTEATGEAPKAADPKAPTAEEAAAAEKYSDDRNLHLLAAGVDEVRFADGRVAEGVSVEQLRSIMGRLGKSTLLRLISEMNAATWEEPVIPAPFSRANSQDDPS